MRRRARGYSARPIAAFSCCSVACVTCCRSTGWSRRRFGPMANMFSLPDPVDSRPDQLELLRDRPGTRRTSRAISSTAASSPWRSRSATCCSARWPATALTKFRYLGRGRDVHPDPQHDDAAARSHDGAAVPDHQAARLGQQLSGADRAVPGGRLRRLPDAAVHAEHPQGPDRLGADRRRVGASDLLDDRAAAVQAGARRAWRCSPSAKPGTCTSGR